MGDATWGLSVTNGCDHPVELVVWDAGEPDDIEAMTPYLTTYEPGETITGGTLAGKKTIYIVAGVGKGSPVTLETIEMVKDEVTYTISGDDCEVASP